MIKNYYTYILHKNDGFFWSKGDKEWLRNGLRHRKGGPAVNFGKRKEWWTDGEFIKVYNYI